jgi:hypothetical protein
VGVLQVVEPLLKWGLGNGVELVHSDKEIFGKDTTFDETDDNMEFAIRAQAWIADFLISLQP